MSADTCTASFDTVLHLRGPAGEIVCTDDTCNLRQSRITATPTPGVGLFQLVVDGFGSGTTGTYTLALTTF